MLNDCTLPDEQTGTTQIDHILLSPYGIFIIETKIIKDGSLAENARNTGHRKYIKIF